MRRAETLDRAFSTSVCPSATTTRRLRQEPHYVLPTMLTPSHDYTHHSQCDHEERNGQEPRRSRQRLLERSGGGFSSSDTSAGEAQNGMRSTIPSSEKGAVSVCGKYDGMHTQQRFEGRWCGSRESSYKRGRGGIYFAQSRVGEMAE